MCSGVQCQAQPSEDPTVLWYCQTQQCCGTARPNSAVVLPDPTVLWYCPTQQCCGTARASRALDWTSVCSRSTSLEIGQWVEKTFICIIVIDYHLTEKTFIIIIVIDYHLTEKTFIVIIFIDYHLALCSLLFALCSQPHSRLLIGGRPFPCRRHFTLCHAWGFKQFSLLSK